MAYDITLDLKQRILHAARGDTRRLGLLLNNLLTEFRRNGVNAARLAESNEVLANRMRRAVVSAYKANVIRRRGHVESYRVGGRGRRFAGGKLLAALESPSMARSSATQIRFIDARLLDRAARQWRRLNFGASPNIGRTTQAISRPAIPPLRFGQGRSFGSLRLAGGPRRGFRVPELPATRGYFLPNGEFHVGKPKKGTKVQTYIKDGRRSTVGIGARRFLDQGMVAFARNFRPVYEEHFQSAARKAIANTKGKAGR